MAWDIEAKTVERIGDGRKAETLDPYWKTLSEEDRDAIEAIAMDMSGPYFASTIRHVRNAILKIVFDRFHDMQHAMKAVDQVRRNEQAKLFRVGERGHGHGRRLWALSGLRPRARPRNT